MPFGYLIGGTWNCKVRIPAIGSHPVETQTSSETYEVAPGNVLHGRTISQDAISDDYYGYDPDVKVYWHSGVDSHGSAAYSISLDGTTYKGYYWSSLMLHKVSTTTTYTKLNGNERSGHFVAHEPARTVVIDGLCQR